jgi:hypothetical protein
MLSPFYIIIATMDNSTRINSTLDDNKRKSNNKRGGNILQHNWSQEEMDTMENSRDNSTNNVRGKGKSKGSACPSC